MSASETTTQATTYVNADTRQIKNNYQIYHLLKKSLNASGTAKIIAKSIMYAWDKVPTNQGKKDTITMHDKTYNGCKCNTAWVEYDPYGKGANVCQLLKKLE